MIFDYLFVSNSYLRNNYVQHLVTTHHACKSFFNYACDWWICFISVHCDTKFMYKISVYILYKQLLPKSLQKTCFMLQLCFFNTEDILNVKITEYLFMGKRAQFSSAQVNHKGEQRFLHNF